MLFTMELLLRVTVFGCAFFTMQGRMWNLFDTVVVALQLFEDAAFACARARTLWRHGDDVWWRGGMRITQFQICSRLLRRCVRPGAAGAVAGRPACRVLRPPGRAAPLCIACRRLFRGRRRAVSVRKVVLAPRAVAALLTGRFDRPPAAARPWQRERTGGGGVAAAH